MSCGDDLALGRRARRSSRPAGTNVVHEGAVGEDDVHPEATAWVGRGEAIRTGDPRHSEGPRGMALEPARFRGVVATLQPKLPSCGSRTPHLHDDRECAPVLRLRAEIFSNSGNETFESQTRRNVDKCAWSDLRPGFHVFDGMHIRLLEPCKLVRVENALSQRGLLGRLCLCRAGEGNEKGENQEKMEY